MASKFEGLTLEISGDTTKLQVALKDVNKQAYALQNELKQVDKLLKLDPSNTELLAQKQDLLTKSIENTETKLNTLRLASEKANEQLQKGEITEEVYRNLQREIIATEQKLSSLSSEAKKVEAAFDGIDIDLENKKAIEAQKEMEAQAEKSAREIEKAYNDINIGLDQKLNDVSTGIIAGVTATTVALGALVEATEEYRTEMGLLQVNTDIANASFNETKEQLKEVTILTGESDSALEGISNLLKADIKGDTLADVVDDLKGAVVALPDTVKFESISDSLQEIVNSGEVTGQFVETLGRMGTELEKNGLKYEDYAIEIENATSAQERLEISLKYLSATGLDEYNQKWEETNQQLIANKEAQYDLNEELSRLATEVEPIMTEFTRILIDMIAIVMENKDEVLLWTGALVGGAAALKGYLFVSQIIDALKKLKAGTDLATTSQLALNVAQSANPIGLVVTAVGALIGVLGVLALTADDTTEKFDDLTNSYNKNMQAIDDNYDSQINSAKQAEILKNRIFELDKELENGTISSQEYNSKQAEMKILAGELTEIFPEVERALYDETGEIKIQRLEVDELTTSFINLAIAQAQSEVYGEKITESLRAQVEAEESLVELQNKYNDALARSETPLGFSLEGTVGEKLLGGLEASEIEKEIKLQEEFIATQRANVEKYAQAQADSLESLNKKSSEEIIDTSDMTLKELDILYEKEYGKIGATVEDTNKVIENSTVSAYTSSAKAVEESVKTQEDLDRERFENNKSWLDKMISTEEITLEEQKRFWETASKKYVEYSDLKEEIDWELLAVQKEINEEKLAEEERINEERIKLEEEFAQKQQESIEKVANLQQGYLDNLDSRSEAIANQVGLFDELAEKEKVSFGELSSNLKDQVSQLEDYNELLEKIGERGVSAELMEEVSAIGLNDIETLRAIANSTDSQLAEYEEYYAKREALSASAAEKQLANEREQTAEAINAIIEETGIAFEVAPELSSEFVRGIAEEIYDETPIAVASAGQMANDMIAELKSVFEDADTLDLAKQLNDEISNIDDISVDSVVVPVDFQYSNIKIPDMSDLQANLSYATQPIAQTQTSSEEIASYVAKALNETMITGYLALNQTLADRLDMILSQPYAINLDSKQIATLLLAPMELAVNRQNKNWYREGDIIDIMKSNSARTI